MDLPSGVDVTVVNVSAILFMALSIGAMLVSWGTSVVDVKAQVFDCGNSLHL